VKLPEQPAVAAALAQSRFARLPPEVVDALLEGALQIELPPGGVPWRQGHPAAAGMIVTGLLRAFHTSKDGRQVTVRYGRRGELLAITSLYVERSGRLTLEALTPCRILVLQPATVRAVADRDARVANILAEEIAHRLINFLDELAGNTFGSMRQRVVRHLLDLAAGPTGQRSPLIARVSQQELADAVGSVREVVVRLLRDLREEGLVRTGRDEIELLEPDRLHGETFPRGE